MIATSTIQAPAHSRCLQATIVAARLKRQRLDRRLRAQAADRVDVLTGDGGDEFRGRRPADAALAAAHADAGHRLQAVDLDRAESRIAWRAWPA